MSGMICLCLSIALILVHFLLLSLDMGTSLPGFLDGQWGLAYTNHIVQPLESLFNNLVLNNVLLIILWGVVGLGVYFLCEYSLHTFGSWHHAEQDIQLAGQQVIAHPARRSFITTVIWRSSMLIIGSAVFIALQPLIQQLLKADPQIVAGHFSPQESIQKILLELVGWTFVAHCTVVFLRLFLMRTRLFGDPAIQ